MEIVLAVAKVELLLLLRDRRFAVAALALWLVVGSMLLVSQPRFLAEQRQMRAAQETARRQWETRTGGSGHALGHYGTYVYRQANPLSLLHPGAEPYVGVAAHIVAHHQTNMFYRPMLDRMALDRWGDVSLTSILQVAVPLLLLLLSFAAVVGDREDGRLLLFLGQGASPVQLAVGKLLGVAGAAALFLLPTLGLVVGVVSFTAARIGGVDQYPLRLASLLGGYAALYLFFLALGIGVSALARTRQAALLLAVGAWAVLCLLLPHFLTLSAEEQYPTPEEDVVQERVDLERKNPRAIRAVQEKARTDTLARYGVSSEQELPVNLGAITVQATEEFVNRIHDHHRGDVWARFQAQERWVEGVGSFLTPVVPVRSLAEGLSSTNSAALRSHVFAIETFRREWIRRLNEADAQRPRRTRGERSEPWASFPPFHHDPPSWEQSRVAAGTALTILWGWALVGVAGSVWCVKVRTGADRAVS